MATRTFSVRQPPDVALQRLLSRPEVGPLGLFVAQWRGSTLCLHVLRVTATVETYPLVPVELRLTAVRQVMHTDVTARLGVRPHWRHIGLSLGVGVVSFGSTWIGNALEWKAIRKRRRSDRADLLALVVATYGPVEINPGDDPFRAD